MEDSFRDIFGGVIAFLLLALYAVTLVVMIVEVVECGRATGCTVRDFGEGVLYVVTTTGGLVSALVVSKLTVTEPGEAPAILSRSASDGGGPVGKGVTTVVVLYLGIWLIVGLAALVVGVMVYPEVNKTVSNIGTTWLGLAVAAGYAYFGIDPKQ